MTKKTSDTQVRRTPTQQRSRVTVESLLEAAEKLLKEQEYACITTTMIAERAGFTVGSLYQYFPDKRAIFAALFESRSKKAAQEIESLISTYISTGIKGLDHLDLAIISIRKLLEIYEEEELIFVRLLEEAPDLRDLSSTTGLENLIKEMAVKFLVDYGFSPEKENIDLMCFMLDSILLDNIKKYVSQSPRPFRKEQLIKELSILLMAYYDFKGLQNEPMNEAQ